jgi:hypothetical protein
MSALPMATTITLEESKAIGLPPIKKNNSKLTVLLSGESSSSSTDDGSSPEKTIDFDLNGLVRTETATKDPETQILHFPLDRATVNDRGIREANSNASSWTECMIMPTNKKMTYYEASQAVRCYRLPCPIAQATSLSTGSGTVLDMEFVSPFATYLHELYKPGGLVIDIPWEGIRRQFRERKDVKSCVRYLKDAVLLGYDTTKINEDCRITLHNGSREMNSALLGRRDKFVHSWETKEKPRGLLLTAKTNTFSSGGAADRSVGQSFQTSNFVEHFAWNHRLIGMDYKDIFNRITLLPPADGYPVELDLVAVNVSTLKVNPQHNRDFLVWMVAHWWTAVHHMTVEYIKQLNKGRAEKIPMAIPDAESAVVVVHRKALYNLLDILYSLSGQRSVVNLCEGLQVRLQVAGGVSQAAKIATWCKESEEQLVRDAYHIQCKEGCLNVRIRVRLTFHEIVQLYPGAPSYNLLLANDGYKQYKDRRQITKESLKAMRVKNAYLMGGSATFMA